jgi:hypothetical protein
MKWIDKSDEKFQKNIKMVGQTRITTKFLWFPKKLFDIEDGQYETRWLETAKFVEKYVRCMEGFDTHWWYVDKFKWKEQGWAK